MSSYICLNPHCKGRRRRFVTDKSFGMHLQKSTSCWHFFRSRMSAGDRSDAEFDHRLIGSVPNLGIAEDTNAFYSSSQRFVPLRCDFVNDDDFSTSSAHLFENASFPVPPHVSPQFGTLPQQPPVFTKYPITSGTNRIFGCGYCYVYTVCYSRHARRRCTLWLIWPPHATNSTPLSVMQHQLHTTGFSLSYMSLFIGRPDGHDRSKWRQGYSRPVVATRSAKCFSKCSACWPRTRDFRSNPCRNNAHISQRLDWTCYLFGFRECSCVSQKLRLTPLRFSFISDTVKRTAQDTQLLILAVEWPISLKWQLVNVLGWYFYLLFCRNMTKAGIFWITRFSAEALRL